jgi:hypothetical protein
MLGKITLNVLYLISLIQPFYVVVDGVSKTPFTHLETSLLPLEVSLSLHSLLPCFALSQVLSKVDGLGIGILWHQT